MKYYKISPEWAKKINVTSGSPVHPDGWFLVLPTRMNRLLQYLPSEGIKADSIDEAVKAIGGCIYTEEEAIRSQEGDKAYMMDGRNEATEQPAESPADPDAVAPSETSAEAEKEVTEQDAEAPAAVTVETSRKVSRKIS